MIDIPVAQIHDRLELLNGFKGRNVHYKEFSHTLKVLAKALNMRYRFVRKKLGFVYMVEGFFNMGVKKKPIDLVLTVNKARKTIDFTDLASFNELRFLISMIVQHESIHQEQYRKNHGVVLYHWVKLGQQPHTSRQIKTINYLRDVDEVEAFAHDIAMEITFRYPKRDPKEILRCIEKRRKVPSYIVYRRTFKGENWTALRKRLLKKAALWLDRCETPLCVVS